MMNLLISLMLKKSDSVPEKLIKDYFSKHPFTNKRLPIIEFNCEDEGCRLNGDFEDYIILNGDNIKRSLKRDEKSVDKIIFLKKVPDKKVDVILCELTKGEKKYSTVVEKIKKSGEYILNLLSELGFKIRDFKCVYVGNYKNSKRLKAKPFSIQGFHKNNITIKRLSCGSDFSQIF